MKNRKVYVTAFCGVCVAMNIVLGIITAALGIPLYLDTLGTVLSAAILGPVPGMIVGSLSNIITGLMYSVTDSVLPCKYGGRSGRWSCCQEVHMVYYPGNCNRSCIKCDLSCNRNTDRYLCIWWSERFCIRYASYSISTGRKEYFPGIIPEKYRF